MQSLNYKRVQHLNCQLQQRRPRRHLRVSSSSSSTPSSSSNSSSSSSTSNTSSSSSSRGEQAVQSSRIAAASGAAVALALAAPTTYDLLSTATLPPLSLLAEVLAGLLAGSVALAKAVHGDNVHLELHKGRLYLQLGVPAAGPPLQPGSVITRPTGDERGNGAYTTRLIPSGTHIADYAGEQLDNAAFFSRYPDGVGDYVMAIDQDTVLDAAAWVAATDAFHPVHMNHSRGRHNVVRYYERSKGRVAFFAERDIQPGEELLYNYGSAYWRGREHLELP